MDTYEKKYKEAQKWIESIYPNLSHEQQMKAEAFFPELKESEDERIRKEIINHLQYLAKYCNESMPNVNKWIAWLEKQGEQKEATCVAEIIDHLTEKEQEILFKELEMQKVQKPVNDTDEDIVKTVKDTSIVDKVEPKFKVGDWMVYEENTYQIHNISLKKYYECLRTDGTVHTFDFEYIDSKTHLWTIEDAKDGDVLVHIGYTFIFMGVKNGIVQALEKYLLEGTNPVCFGEPDKDNDYYPATKEQRDALMKAMADVGYTFDFEKKELKKIEHKPAWSEEDERTYKSVLYAFEHHYPLNDEQQKFVKSIKDRTLPQSKQEWSKEDEKIYSRIYDLIHAAAFENYEVDDIGNELGEYAKMTGWLKSLKERYTWKPSERQLECLGYAIEKAEKDWSPLTNNRIYLTLKALKEQLEKL